MSMSEEVPQDITEQIETGDTVTVNMGSSPFGNGQEATFKVTEVSEDTVEGVDPNWGDVCEILAGGGRPHYSDFGKSGDVNEIRVMDTTDDGIPIHGSGTVIYQH